MHLDLTATNKIFDNINLTGDDLTADDVADFRAVLQAVAGPERSRLVSAVDHAVDGNALAYVGVDRRVITYASGVNLAIVSVLWWP